MFGLLISLIITLSIGVFFNSVLRKAPSVSVSVCFVVGLVVLSFVYLFANQIGVRPIVLSILISIVSLYWIFKNRSSILSSSQVSWHVLILIVVSVLLTSVFWNQGIKSSGELVVSRAGENDSYWHIAIEESLNRSIPPENPIYSGSILRGYHYLSDLYLVFVHQFSGISFPTLYYSFYPLILSFMFVFTSWNVFLAFTNDKNIALVSTLIYTCGSGFAYMAPFVSRFSTSAQSVFWLDQPLRYVINPPLILSLSVVNVIVYLLIKHPRECLLSSFLLGSLIGIKAYGFIVYFIALSCYTLVSIVYNRDFNKAVTIFCSIVVVFLILLTTGSPGGSPFFIQPGWFVQTMYASSDRLNDVSAELKRQYYYANGNVLRTTLWWITGLSTFFIGNLGVKTLSLLLIIPVLIKKRISNTKVFLGAVLFTSMVAPMFLLQKGVVWNTIQFLHYAQLPLTIFMVLVIVRLFKKLSLIILVAVLIISLPTTISTFINDRNAESYITYSQNYLDGLNKIKNSKKTGIYLGEGLRASSMVPAFTGRSVYVADPISLSILQIDETKRIKRSDDIIAGKINCPPLSYVLVKPESFTILNAEKIYIDKELVILKCN